MISGVCPCGSGADFAACCSRFISGREAPSTAVLLMRSRYSAYVVGDEAYLLRTWHPSTRPPQLNLVNGTEAKWLGLKIISFVDGCAGDDNGEVEFVARYKLQGRAVRLHEHSRFVRERGHWYYLDGQIN